MMYGIIWRIARPPIVLAMYGWMTDCKLLARRVKTTGLAVRPPLTDVDVHRRRCLIDTRIPINCGLTLNRVRPARCSRGFNALRLTFVCLDTEGKKRDRLEDYNFLFKSLIWLIWRSRSTTMRYRQYLLDFWGKCVTKNEIWRKEEHKLFLNTKHVRSR